MAESGFFAADDRKPDRLLTSVIDDLARECAPCGWNIRYAETPLTADDIAQSNIILFNGQPIEDVLPEASAGESHCQSCCEFTGSSETACRTVTVGDKRHEAIPAALIRQAVCQIANCCA